MSEDAAYGSGFYKAVSADLSNEFPKVKSFSPTNLKYMQYFFEMYANNENRPQAVDNSASDGNRPQLGEDFVYPEIFRILWGHNKAIIDRCRENREKAIFYVRKTLANNWSRAVLLNFLDTDLYERQGKALSEFPNTNY